MANEPTGVSQTYVSALAIILVSLLGVFKVEIGNEVITALLTGILGVWVAIRRYKQGNIQISGVRK